MKSKGDKLLNGPPKVCLFAWVGFIFFLHVTCSLDEDGVKFWAKRRNNNVSELFGLFLANTYTHHFYRRLPMSIQRFFSYCPRSGSRVLAAKPNQFVAIGELEAGTLAVGSILVFSIDAAQPGKWWRALASRVARDIVESVGGLAEDANGTVTLAVPAQYTKEVFELIYQIAPNNVKDDIKKSLSIQAYRQKLGKIIHREGGFIVELEEKEPEEIFVLPARYNGFAVAVVTKKEWEDWVFQNIPPKAPLFVTNKGRPFSVTCGDDIIVETGSPIEWKQWDGDQAVENAVYLSKAWKLPDDITSREYYCSEERVPWNGEPVVTFSNIDDCPVLQVWVNHLHGERFLFEQFLRHRTASQVNAHHFLPSWAGWDVEIHCPVE